MPMEWDDHTIHAATHTEAMKKKEFKESPPQIKQLFVMHYKGHQQYILQEQQAMMQMTQPVQAPAPKSSK